MAKIFKCFLVAILTVVLSACEPPKSQAEKDLEEAQKRLAQSEEAARKAEQDYEDLVDTLDEYNRLREKLNN